MPIILGAGFTGLAAGLTSGLPIYEATGLPGGICSSYYLSRGEPPRLPSSPVDGEAYRFELGGGHWIFGADQEILDFLNPYASFKRYERQSSVFFPDRNLFVPYPLQNHLSYLPDDLAQAALSEIMQDGQKHTATMAQWLEENFGKVLCELFFFPFHELYTAGLYTKIAPQDSFKSPLNLDLVIRGAREKTPDVGYNATFVYPTRGLNELVKRLAMNCPVNFNKRVVRIDIQKNNIFFADGTEVGYDQVISTLPLNLMMEMTGLSVASLADPYTAVLVINIGAVRAHRCPDDHWLYIPHSESRFHRVGFYSNVDESFLPQSSRDRNDRVSIYVERSFPGGEKPLTAAIREYEGEVIRELQDWGFIGEAEVVDATWIPIAYTWSWPGSEWHSKAINLLQQHNIYQIGRYGAWRFQGIADSIRDGLSIANYNISR